MAHWLGPPEGQPYLPPAEVAHRLEAEFAVVEADADAGAEIVAGMIRQFERMGFPAECIEEHRQLQPLAVQVLVADDPDPGEAYLQFCVLPGRAILVGYCSVQHEQAAGPLLDRCCKALGYVSELA